MSKAEAFFFSQLCGAYVIAVSALLELAPAGVISLGGIIAAVVSFVLMVWKGNRNDRKA